MREKRNSIAFFVLALILLSGIFAEGGVVYTRLINTSYVTKWYEYLSGTSGKINFNNTPLSAGLARTLYTYNDIYTLTVTGNVTFNPYLGRDFSSGGYARGYFEGAAEITITGGLMNGSTYVYGGTGANAKQILKAVMLPIYEDTQNPALQRWALQEDTTAAGNFNKTLLMSMVEGSEGLASGITLTNGDILKMTGPKTDLFFKCSNVSNFYIDMGPFAQASSINITGLLPEPATILMLGLGVVCLRKKR
jgi:hypothetical protein